MTDLTEIRRAKFEAAMDAADKNPGVWLGDRYSNWYGETAWIGFNAALDSCVVELPKIRKCGEWSDLAGYEQDDMIDAIHAAGVKTK